MRPQCPLLIFEPHLPLWVDRDHAFGQSDGAVVTVVQLLQDEAEVGLEQRRRQKPPEQRREVHEHGHQKKDVGEELQRGGKMKT